MAVWRVEFQDIPKTGFFRVLAKSRENPKKCHFRVPPPPPPKKCQKPEKRPFLGVHILNNILIALVVSNPDFRPLRGSHDSLKRGTRGKFRHTPTGPFPPFLRSSHIKKCHFWGPKTAIFQGPKKLCFSGSQNCDFPTSYKTAVLSKNLKKPHFSDAVRKWRFVDIFTNLAKTRNLAFCQVSEKTTECDDQRLWSVCH